MVLGSLSSNFYNKIDSTGIQVGGYDWYSIRLAYGSLYLSADQWMDNDPSTIKLGFYGGGGYRCFDFRHAGTALFDRNL